MGKHRIELRREWTKLAPAWIEEAREGTNPTRNGLIDPPMLEACGDVRGLSILDCGCGEGRFCRILVERGARYVMGLDLCEPMIEAARELQCERDEYRIADVQDLSFISLSTYTQSFLETGFTIDGIVEPTVNAEQLADYPELDDELRVPNFIIYILRKP